MKGRRDNDLGCRRTTSGFTLVELLVSIGIISILMSLLLPALTKVRKQSDTTRCANNLRNFGQAWQLYVNASQGTVPPGRLPTSGAPGGVFDLGPYKQYRPHWYELLGAMNDQYPAENPQPFEDDSWTIRKPGFLCRAVPDWTNSRNYPYGYNYQFLGNARKGTGGGWIRYPVKASGIIAAQTVMAADCLGTAAGRPAQDRVGYYGDGKHDTAAIGNKGWCIDPPRLTGDSDYADPENRSPECRAGPDPRHAGKANVVFCDGHVQLMTPQEMGYAVLADGSMPISGGGATNVMFSGRGEDLDPPPVAGVTSPAGSH